MLRHAPFRLDVLAFVSCLGAGCGEPGAVPGVTAASDAATPEFGPSTLPGDPSTPEPAGDSGSASPRDELPVGNGAGELTPSDIVNADSPGAALADAGGATPPEAPSEAACPFSGSVRYRLNGAEAWPPDVRDQLVTAMDAAVGYYNCYAELSHELTVNYNPGVPTAEANVDGWMSFGSNRAYMVVATAMHEVGHTLGVGYFPWGELIVGGRWSGPAVTELITRLPAAERDPDAFSQRDYITADAQHFWPYGLNQAAEHQSEWSLINHVRLVAALQRDKRAYESGEL